MKNVLVCLELINFWFISEAHYLKNGWENFGHSTKKANL